MELLLRGMSILLTDFRPDLRHALYVEHVSLERVGKRSPAEDVRRGAAAAGTRPSTVPGRGGGAARQDGRGGNAAMVIRRRGGSPMMRIRLLRGKWKFY